MDPGISLFNGGGVSLNFDLQNGVQKEEDEEAEEIKIKEKELQDLLHTEFDDLIDDDVSSVGSESSHRGQEQQINVGPKLLNRHRWPLGIDNETSTPKHQLAPPWTMEYTPINQVPNTLIHNKEGVHQRETGHMTNGHANYGNGFTDVADYHRNENNAANGSFVRENCESGGDDDVHRHYATEVIRLKETIVDLQEESTRNIRLLKHQLILAKGEKESLAFSLQQSRQILTDREKDDRETSKTLNQLETQLKSERELSQELREKLSVSQSSVEALREQLTEMTKFETYAFAKEKQDSVIKQMESRHQLEMEAAKRNVQAKEVEIERLSSQLDKLEKYQSQTLPHKLRGIEQLTRNLETVDEYCQKLLVTGSFQNIEKIRSEESNESKNIQSLLNAITDLGTKLTTDRPTPPQAVDPEIAKLREENQRLRGTMETMIKKQDADIKSAIEKYHSLHSKETKLIQNELSDAAEEEKDRLRSFYEGKLTNLYSDTENLKSSLDEIKNLYVKVCEEKNELEIRIQNTELDLSKAIEAEKRQWETNKTKQIENVNEEIRINFYQKEQEWKQQLASNELKLDQLSDSKAKLIELELALSDTRTQLEAKEKQCEEMRVRFTAEWKQRQQHLNLVFNAKLEEIGKAQKEEVAAMMADVEKAVRQEQSDFVSRHAELINTLKEDKEIAQRQIKEMKNKPHTKDISTHVCLTTSKEKYLTEQTEKMANAIEQYKIKFKRDKDRLENRKSANCQTEEKLVSRKSVLELNSLYKEIIHQIKDEVEMFMLNSHTVTAEHIQSAIVQFYNEIETKTATKLSF